MRGFSFLKETKTEQQGSEFQTNVSERDVKFTGVTGLLPKCWESNTTGTKRNKSSTTCILFIFLLV